VRAQLNSEVLQAVARASKRSSALVREEMRRDVYGLATVASLAPWIGIFGTLLGIANSFPGIAGARREIVAAIYGNLARSLWPTALGLLVGLMSLFCFESLAERLRTLEQEMENASLELLNQLSRFRGKFTAGPAINRPIDLPLFGERSLDELQLLRRRPGGLAALAAAFCLCWSLAELLLGVHLP
jgi:hypothetical protein